MWLLASGTLGGRKEEKEERRIRDEEKEEDKGGGRGAWSTWKINRKLAPIGYKHHPFQVTEQAH